MMISIIIPAYNEEKRISKSLLTVSEFFKKKQMDHEIIVVDDGSTDRTSQLLQDLNVKLSNLRVIHYKKNMGKGFALKRGVLASNGDLVLISDADLSTPIEEVEKMMPFILTGTCEIVIGSRALKSSRIIKRQPWWREAMGKIFNRIVRALVLDDFLDTQCGFKLFSGKVARDLFNQTRINGFAYDVEILFHAKRRGYRIVEMPVVWINSPDSKVRPLLDSFRMLIDILRIWAQSFKI